jgi:transposase
MPRKRVVDPDKMVDRIKRLLDCESDSDLARRLETQQPQIARWRRGEFSKSMGKLVDYLLLIISRMRREINELEKEIQTLKQKRT